MSETGLIALYAHRPKPYGGGAEYRLYPTNIAVEQGRIKGDVPLTGIVGVRLLYKPRNSTNEGYEARLLRGSGRSIAITNLSWKSLVAVEREDADYRRFVLALVPAIARANPGVALMAGLPRWLHAAAALAGFAAVSALALMTGQALLNRSLPLALILALLGLYFGWWTWRFLSRNRPRRFTADDIPQDVLPPA